MKVQMKFQKIICLLMLIVSGISFILSLGLLTDIYYVQLASSFGVVDKKDNIFKSMQPFNNDLIVIYITLIVLSALLILTNTNTRRKYYISNFVNIGVITLFSLGSTIYTVVSLVKFKHIFKTEVDFERWKEVAEVMKKLEYTESTFWLDINMAASILVAIVSLLLLGNMIWKIILVREENKLLSNQHIQPSSMEVAE